MPFEVNIDRTAGVVRSVWEGVADEGVLIAYIDQVWTDPGVRGYGERIDFRLVTDVQVRNDSIREIAAYSRLFDNPDEPARSAVVAPQALVCGLSRMFASIRRSSPKTAGSGPYLTISTMPRRGLACRAGLELPATRPEDARASLSSRLRLPPID